MKAIVGGTVYTITGGVIEGGTVFVDGTRIAGVEERAEVPAGTEVIDARGKVVMPGIIDAHTHLGIWGEGNGWAGLDFNETSDPATPEMRGLDGINPFDPAFADAREAGITTVLTGPGSANVIGGEWVALKTVGTIADEMVLLQPAGLKAALGENPKKVYGDRKRTPVTRMGVAAVLRTWFTRAREYMERQDRAGRGIGEAAAVDLQLEAVARALRGEEPVRIHAHRADDIVTAVRLGREFHLDITIEHATEGHKVAEFLAASGAPCSVGPLLFSRTKEELAGMTLANPGILARAGVKVAIHSDTTSGCKFLLVAAGLAVREGMPEAEALRAVTLNAAEMLGVSGRVGSLEAGKDADLVVFSGHPFHTYTTADVVMIDGAVVHRRDAGGEGARLG